MPLKMLCESQNLAGMELPSMTAFNAPYSVPSEVELSINVECLPQDPIAYETYKILATET
jgi:hypothetical protein